MVPPTHSPTSRAVVLRHPPVSTPQGVLTSHQGLASVATRAHARPHATHRVCARAQRLTHRPPTSLPRLHPPPPHPHHHPDPQRRPPRESEAPDACHGRRENTSQAPPHRGATRRFGLQGPGQPGQGRRRAKKVLLTVGSIQKGRGNHRNAERLNFRTGTLKIRTRFSNR